MHVDPRHSTNSVATVVFSNASWFIWTSIPYLETKMPPVWTELAAAAALVRDGDLVALGGHTQAAPMALLRELIRQGRQHLGLVTVPTGGLNVDLAVGAGLADRIHFAQVVLEEYGMAPHFRRAVEQGHLACREYS